MDSDFWLIFVSSLPSIGSEHSIGTSQLVKVNLVQQPQSIPCPADLDGDGQVSISDIVTIAEKWNAVSPNYPYAPGFDLMPVGAPDGAITIGDIQHVAGHWGQTCTD